MSVMNENERELESHATSLKHRIGKTMLLVGVIMVIIGIIASFKLSVMFYLLTLTSTEFQYINTLSSNAQTQLDAKATKGFSIAMGVALG